MQKKVIVIGGGFAGLTAASYLAKNKIKVTLLESSPKLGGRSYSFIDKETDTVIDNGQHILMGCYDETLKFLEMIGAKDNFLFQKNLCVNFVKEGFQLYQLKSSPIFYPLNLLLGFLSFSAISFSERLKLLKVFLKVPFYSSKDLRKLNISEWLNDENQSAEIQNAFWKILAVGTLNTSLEDGSAKIFVDILKKIFLNGNFSSTIILPKYGLSESYCSNAKKFIESNGGEVRTSQSVNKLVIENNSITEIHCADQTYTDFDFVVSAVPVFSFTKMIDQSVFITPEFTYSSILNIHLWLKNNPLNESFYGLIDSPVHWVFNKSTHINIVISDAGELINKSDEELIGLVSNELNKFLKIGKDEITQFKIVKEKRATLFLQMILLIKDHLKKRNSKIYF
jgi:squalene-associated FAD-dependent desaturase